MRKRIYIAGPITKGDLAHNIRQAEVAFFRLLKAGHAPLCPHWSCYSTGPINARELPGMAGFVYAHATAHGGGNCTHADWLGADLPWVAVSDAVLRLPGESSGADAEVAHALANDIRVFLDLDELLVWAAE